MFTRVAIIGLGLIGGSIGLALRRSGAASEVVGYDLGKGVSDHARRIGAIEQAYTALPDAVRGADLVVLATPVGAMHALLQDLAPALTPGTVVTDVASTKRQVLAWAEKFLPSSVAFVGGHPMAGKELSGVEAADPDLFCGRVYCLTPTAQTNPAALEMVTTMIHALGARVRFLDPAEHDKQVACISHLPFLASTALVQTVANSPAWGEMALLASSGFRDVTRLAAGNSQMYRDICLTNGEAIVQCLDDYIETLQTLRSMVAAGDRTIENVFVEAQQERLRWQASHDQAEPNCGGNGKKS
ncbi:prephenate dehydrogenase [Thermosporothrix hazakensis]|jgi:prephenate dehydrogenase|uniref:Prephenate dehydrogenase n=1 Tax=Thermosporothrix hazakensis TaxID=644383 RepID=A0A326ULJ7_THEHA|nr:prephenate dehydrogenase/arogenate dehydrogenase family protein [Thermosporothrix hazakensis]PZW30564.1 prephenate dehydrogenase [Thermosporothrix hazakensis]GCE49426.1 prephenate dehydrogenase [Thermosporothrix hazakensis]